MIGEVEGFAVEFDPDGCDVLVSTQQDRVGDGLDRRLVVAKTAPTARRELEPTGLVGSSNWTSTLNGPDSQGSA
jgi:hypothetical protein